MSMSRAYLASASTLVCCLAACDSPPNASQETPAAALSAQALTLPAAVQTVLDFEDHTLWNVSSGSTSRSSIHTEGTSSLAYKPFGFAYLYSPTVTLQGAPEEVAFDLQLPAVQPNPWWFGAVQLYIHAPSRGVHNAYVGSRELTGLAVSTWHSLKFPVPEWLRGMLGTAAIPDAVFTIVLNVPHSADPGPYLFDRLRAQRVLSVPLQDVGDIDVAVDFDGFLRSPQTGVTVQAAVAAAGPFVNVGVATSSHAIDPNRTETPTYNWALRAPISRSAWQEEATAGADGCKAFATHVRAQSQGQVMSFGRVRAYNVYEGNVTISTQADADRFRCYGAIRGNLTVLDSADFRISLPHLRRVIGNVRLVYPTRVIPAGGCLEVRQFVMPLSDVTGAVALSATAPSDKSIDFGLNELRRVGGALSVDVRATNVGVAGLDALQTADGDVSLKYSGDVGLYRPTNRGVDGVCVPAQERPALLGSLKQVRGSLDVRSGYDAYHVLPALSTVNRDVFIGARVGVNFLSALSSVSGTLKFGTEAARAGGRPSAFTALRSVGALEITGTRLDGWPINTPEGETVKAARLLVENNASLPRIETSIRLVPSLTAPATIRNNAVMTTADVCAWVSAQRAVGWSGPLVLDTATTCGRSPPPITFTEIAREFVGGFGWMAADVRPVINGSGVVVFAGTHTHVTPPFEPTRIFAGSGPPTSLSAVNLSALNLTVLHSLAVDNAGRVAFVARRATSGIPQGVHLTSVTGAPITTVYEGATASGSYDPAKPYAGTSVALSPGGTLAYSAIVNGAGAIYRGPAGGMMTVLRTGTGTFYNTRDLDVNDAGQLAVQMEYGDLTTGRLSRGVLVLQTPGADLPSVKTAVEKLDIGTQPTLAINKSGTVAFALNTTSTIRFHDPPTSGSGPVVGEVTLRPGVYKVTPAQYGIVRTFTTIADNSGSFATFGRVAINAAGLVVFEASTREHTFGIYRGADPALDKVVQTGDTRGAVLFSWLRMGSLNDAGQLAILTSDFYSTDRQVWRIDGL